MRSTLIRALALVVGLSTAALAGAYTKGTLVYKAKAREYNVTLRFGYLVKGPDAVDQKTILRRLILSAADLSATLQKCTTMSCADGSGADAIMIDLGAGPRLNYWLNLGDGLVQYSGTETTKSLATTTDTPARLAGRLAFDASGAGGPKVSVDFDVNLLKEFTRAR